jgi:uncharacterized MAPEG superfamily protein
MGFRFLQLDSPSQREAVRMTPELFYLVWSVALTVVLVVIAALGAMQQVGLPKLAGNREHMPEILGWGGRAERAHRHMLESLVLFAILVLAARALNVANSWTVLGAQLFFWGRLVHAALYIAGIPWLRTAAWLVSVLGLLLLFLQLVH